MTDHDDHRNLHGVFMAHAPAAAWTDRARREVMWWHCLRYGLDTRHLPPLEADPNPFPRFHLLRLRRAR